MNEILLSALTVDDVIARLVGEASVAAGADKSLIIEVEADRYTVTHVRGVRPGLVGKPMDPSFFPGFAATARERRPILIGDNWTDSRTNKEFVVPYELRAFQLLPLVVDGEVTHVLALAYDECREFDDEDYESAVRMAAAMSMALKNARLFEAQQEAQRQAMEELETTQLLLETAETLSTWTDVESALDRLAGILLRSTGQSRVTINLWDGDRKELRTVVSVGVEPMPAATFPLDVLSPHMRKAISSKKTTRFDYETLAKRETSKLAAERAIRLGLIIPLVYRDRVVGLVGVDSPGERREISEREVALLEGIAAQASAAVANAQLFDDVDKARERLSDVLDSMTDGFVSVDHEWRYRLVNPKAEELIGRPAAELIGESMEELYPEMLGWVHYRTAMEQGTAATFEVWSKPLEVWLEVHVYPTSEGIAILFADISERKAAQTEIARRTALLEGVNAVLDQALHVATEKDLASACLTVAEAITGSEFGFIGEVSADGMFRDVSISNPGWDACLMYDSSGHRRPPSEFQIHGIYGEVLRTGDALFTNDPASHPASIGVPEGHPSLTAFLGVPLFSGGRVSGMIGVGNRPGGYREEHQQMLHALAPAIAEALQRKRAERELAEAVQRLDAHINNSPLAVVEFDSEFRVMRWSDEACEVFGWTAEEVLGKAIAEIPWVHEEDAELVDIESAELVTGVGRSLNVNRNYRKDGSIIWCEWYDSALYDENGDMVSILSQVLDITERRRAEAALKESEQRLRAIIEAMPVGVTLVAPGGTVLESNEAFRSLLSAAKVRPADGSPELTRIYTYDPETGLELGPAERPAVRTLTEGEHVRDSLVDIELPDSSRQTNLISVTPLEDAGGEVTSAVVVIQDVTERRERERLEAALNDISASIMATLDSEEVLRRLVQLSRDALRVDTASLAVRDHSNWVVREYVPAQATPTATALTDPTLESALLGAEDHAPIAINDVRHDARVDAKIMRRLGVRSVMVVPLVVQKDVIAAISFYHRERTVAFSGAQLEFAERLMGIATLALENARLYEREHRIADTLQEAVLTEPATAPGIETSVLYRPASSTANIGGDFYDVFRLDDGGLGIVVGDVSGKGLEAARMTSLLHDAIRAYAYEDSDPGAVLGRVNRLVHRLSPPEMFATVFFGVLDPLSGKMAYCVAGHPSPVVVTPKTARSLKGDYSPLVGGFAAVDYRVSETTLGAGDMLVLYTDGITEARDGDGMFGETRLVAALNKLRHSSTEQMPHRLLSVVLEFSAGKLRDDTVVLCVRRTGEVSAE